MAISILLGVTVMVLHLAVARIIPHAIVASGIARIVGPPENFIGTNVWGEPGYAENVATFGGKAGGIVSVDGVLYMFIGPGSTWDAVATTYLAWSNDLGASWQKSSDIFFRATTDGFGPPLILNFGQDYEGARDNYMYLYSTDLSAGENGPFVDVDMARVHKDQIKKSLGFRIL